MDFRHMQTFQAVVKHASFVRAAEELQYAQSTVTLHIQQLESELGVELFTRQGKKVKLTEAGRTLREQVDHILGRVDTLRQSMQELGEGEAGHVRIGAIEPTASRRLPPVLFEFSRDRPKVRLTVEVEGTATVSRRVASGDLDFGVCSAPAPDLGLVFEPLVREPMGLLVPEGHALASKEAVYVDDLGGSQFVLTEPNCAYRQLIERSLQEQGTNVFAGVEMGSINALVWAVRSRLGVAIVPLESVVPAPGGTVLREIEQIDIALSVGIVRRARHEIESRAARELLALIRSCLRR
ncbi:MAG: LysR family transcriptional regulator, regulator of the ytmI operon [Chloroflexia bacterium]|jgi:DNA-binding transcriptional LysR family regulator|nr:LysR family transcriptional regulator, regulator of the ytmI operon [Chloroflexia bacterium]